ncbi:hypothetical protein QT711_06625 [Sporosarcina saromensis]|uniref:Uncharacterized protein n=1 Tax=Sporosarcina saromensis TaxID=359365 RepID=A0ABU4G7B9_9BACL|nr:hypothetical protein [Sporosarcina saromensis]MDW0112854.1 hypothetical protein [Sporosarcina saromensis]
MIHVDQFIPFQKGASRNLEAAEAKVQDNGMAQELNTSGSYFTTK